MFQDYASDQVKMFDAFVCEPERRRAKTEERYRKRICILIPHRQAARFPFLHSLCLCLHLIYFVRLDFADSSDFISRFVEFIFWGGKFDRMPVNRIVIREGVLIYKSGRIYFFILLIFLGGEGIDIILCVRVYQRMCALFFILFFNTLKQVRLG